MDARRGRALVGVGGGMAEVLEVSWIGLTGGGSAIVSYTVCPLSYMGLVTMALGCLPALW